MNMILVGLVLFRDMPFTLLVNVLVDWITKSVRMIRLKINLIMKPLDKPARAFYSSNIRAHPAGRSQHNKNSTAVTKRSRFRSATERAAHRLRGGFAGRRIEGSFRAGSLNISKRFRIAHVTGQENKVRWYRETFALLHTYAEGRFFDP